MDLILQQVDAWSNEMKKWVFHLLKQESSGVSTMVEDLLIVNNYDANFMTGIYEHLLPIAYGMVIVYFLMDLIDKYTTAGRNLSLEQYIFAIFKLIVAESVLKYGATIIGLACSLGNVLIHYWVTNPIGYGGGGDPMDGIIKFNQTLYDAINDWGMSEVLMGCIVGILIKISAVIPNLMIILHAISRKFEIIIRGGFSCISFPDIFTEGKNSGCIRFIKKMTAVSLHGAVIVLIVSLSTGLQTMNVLGAFSNGEFNLTDFQAMFSPFLYSFAAVGTISASKGMINDALGV